MVLKLPPPGITPPFLLTFDASSAPAIQFVSSSAKISDAKIFDFAQNVIRQQLAMVVGAAAPSTCGGKVRQPRIGVDQAKLRSYGLPAQDVVRNRVRALSGAPACDGFLRRRTARCNYPAPFLARGSVRGL